MKRLLLVVLLILVMPAIVAADLVPITKLGVAPWLGEVNEKNLLEKFRGEKPNFVNYIRYDLKKAVGLEISSAEAIKIVDVMESTIKKGAEKMYFLDGTIFKSMGWKSRKTGKIMRTANPVLRLRKETEGFLVKVNFKDYNIEYVFLGPCGNICLKEIKVELPPKAEYVPLPKEEAPLPKAEVSPLPPPPKAEAPTPVAPVVNVYVVYVSPPPPPAPPPAPALVPGCYPAPPPFVYRQHYWSPPIYYAVPSVSGYWSSGIVRPPHYHPAPRVRPPHVRTVPPAIKPPTVHTRPPKAHSAGPPGVQTR